ncbi:hypothetical protein [Halobacterium wangiae]|uniref:hypothetical protein n=1 Tax=Halobacterium wangiae TaxID=2902623 RepID=UPI001E2C93E7|nr:hypothetical protein [Halobacterium wangiae]
MQTIRRAARATGSGLAASAAVGSAAAHSGTTHAGTPHWLLFVLVLLGGAVTAGAVAAYRRRVVGGATSAIVALSAAVVGAFGLVGLVELQVVAETPPTLTDVYPTLSLVVGVAMAVGSLVVGRLRWPQRPRYAGLGLLLAAWVVYPVAMPNGGVYNPLGHVLVVGVVLAVGYVLWRDARAVVQSLRHDRRPLGAGLLAGPLFSVFFLFSAGTLTLNPDSGVGAPTESLVVFLPVSDPLVAWPAVEFVFPSVPMAGYFSVGTVLLLALLGSLVSLNVGVMVQQWRAGTADSSGTSALGMAATTGATACCCCAPAFYGVLSVVFGAAATPAYWAFLDPSSPVGGVFFAASVVLLLGSVVRAVGGGRAQSLQ